MELLNKFIITKINKKMCYAGFLYNMTLKSIIISILILTGIQFSLDAQETKSAKPSWLFETVGDANLSFYTTNNPPFSEYFITPSGFNDGEGIGLFATPLIGFDIPNLRMVSILQARHESRRSLFDEAISPSDFKMDLKSDLDYIAIEHNDSTYQKAISLQDKGADTNINGTLCNTEKSIILVDFHPYFGQDQRSIESWDTSIVRAGIGLIFGRGLTMSAAERIDD